MQKDTGTRIVEIADELQALASNGLHWASNEYDEARFHKVIALAAELLSMADSREAPEIEREFRGNLGIRTPLVGVCAAVFNEDGKILLVQRTDDQRWCMPGGAADVGEPPSAGAVRETWEETGLRVRATNLVGVYDSRLLWPRGAMHLYHLDFICEVTGGELQLTHETLAYGYFSEEEIAALPMHRAHGLRALNAFKFRRGEFTEAMFH